MSPDWLAIGVEPLVTEEPYEGNLQVRVCGGVPGNRASTRKLTPSTAAILRRPQQIQPSLPLPIWSANLLGAADTRRWPL